MIGLQLIHVSSMPFVWWWHDVNMQSDGGIKRANGETKNRIFNQVWKEGLKELKRVANYSLQNSDLLWFKRKQSYGEFPEFLVRFQFRNKNLNSNAQRYSDEKYFRASPNTQAQKQKDVLHSKYSHSALASGPNIYNLYISMENCFWEEEIYIYSPIIVPRSGKGTSGKETCHNYMLPSLQRHHIRALMSKARELCSSFQDYGFTAQI